MSDPTPRLSIVMPAHNERDRLPPVLDTYLSASVKIRESHDCARPMIHLDPRHKLSEEFRRLYGKLESSPARETKNSSAVASR